MPTFDDPIITTTSDMFSAMRGHIQNDTVIIFSDGSRGQLHGTLRGFELVDVKTRQVLIPAQSHWSQLERQVQALEERLANANA